MDERPTWKITLNFQLEPVYLNYIVLGCCLPFECEGEHVTPLLWMATLEIVNELSVVVAMESELHVLATMLQSTCILQHLVVNVANLHHRRFKNHRN